jgi:DNA primase small subunit
MAEADAPAEVNGADKDKEKIKLEELFDDADSDEEFSSSVPQSKSEESSQPAPMYSTPCRLLKCALLTIPG